MDATQELISLVFGIIALVVIVFDERKALTCKDPEYHRIRAERFMTPRILPLLAVSLFLTFLVVISNDRDEMLFGAVLLLEFFTPILIVLTHPNSMDRVY